MDRVDLRRSVLAAVLRRSGRCRVTSHRSTETRCAPSSVALRPTCGRAYGLRQRRCHLHPGCATLRGPEGSLCDNSLLQHTLVSFRLAVFFVLAPIRFLLALAWWTPRCRAWLRLLQMWSIRLLIRPLGLRHLAVGSSSEQRWEKIRRRTRILARDQVSSRRRNAQHRSRRCRSGTSTELAHGAVRPR